MMTKFFPHGTGGGAGPVNYVMGAVEQGKGQVMAGDPIITRQLIDTAPGRHRYTSGVISFGKDEAPTDEQLRQVIEDYNRFFSADDAVSVNALWVKHEDKGRTELHFVIPNIDLNTGRSYHPYIDKLDRKTVDTLQTAIIAEHGFADPKDPARKQLLSNPNDYLKTTKDKKALVEAVNSYMTDLMTMKLAMGESWTHSDTLSAINDLGLEITRHGKNYITVQNEQGIKARLKGGIYERDCVIDGASPEATARASERHREQLKQRVGELRADYEKRLQKRRERAEKRYHHGQGFSQKSQDKAIERGRESHQRHQVSQIVSGEAGQRAEQHRTDHGQAHVKDGNYFYRCANADIGAGAGRSVGSNGVLHQTAGTHGSATAALGSGAERQADKRKDRHIHSDAARGGLLFHDQGREASLQAPRVIEIEFKGRRLGEIVDYGSSLVARGMSARAAAFNIVREAQAKGWKAIELDGDSAFLENAMKMALRRGIDVVPKSKSQELMLERVRKEVMNDRARKAAERAVAQAVNANRNLERASANLEQQGKSFDRASGAFEQRIGRGNEFIKQEVAAMADMELERFKTEINLVDYMQSQGWTLNKKKSTKKTAVLDAPDGRKALVSVSANGHYVWHDPTTGTGGSIIDFVKMEHGLNLGQVRKELRPLLAGGISLSQSPHHHAVRLERLSRDEMALEHARMAMTEKYAQLGQLDDRYLRSRGITISGDPRFGNVRTDERGNTCFPHYQGGGVVGWEAKNHGFTGYADGGKKVGIYATTNFREAKRVVVVESGIDAMSHAQLFGTGQETAYVSFGGSISKDQLKLLTEKLKDREVVLAVDNDDAGERFAQQLADALGRDLNWSRPDKVKDWNDALRVERERAATRTRDHEFELGM